MDMVYASIDRMFEGKLFFAPLKNPQMIEHMGTGTGSLYDNSILPNGKH
jgi:hypothetical protein